MIKYELTLSIDTLTREDITNKLYVVKDYREFNSKIDKFEAFVVPSSRKGRTLDTSEVSTDANRLQRQRLISGQGCMIRNEFIGIGELVPYPELCVSLVCKENGNVDARSMNEEDCRRRKKSRNK